MLTGEGFQEVYNLSGGIKAWTGGKAEGPVELNLDMVRGDETPVEIVGLAYGMENSLGTFYRRVKDRTQDKELADLLENLAWIEDKHKQYLVNLYNDTESKQVSREEFEASETSRIMEGGFGIDDFLHKNERFLTSVPSLLDIAMMLETQALDLYIRFSRKTENGVTAEMLLRIADEEKAHLESLGRLRDERA
ncbi:MAG: ferritin family protein [Desulfomonilaceae bacterium]|nr:ferritin family protein [Desulfomonilaceae bacterium]